MNEKAYHAATREAVLLERPDRLLLRVSGRSPARMLNGMLTGAMPPDLRELDSGVLGGRFPCSLILTPKGRIVTTLRVGRLEDGEAGSLLLDLPATALEATEGHMARYLPPRFARVEEPEEPVGMITLVGPEGAGLLSREALGLRVDADLLAGLDENDARMIPDGSPTGIRVIRNREVLPFAADVIAEATTLAALRSRLEALGVPTAGAQIWETLRIERGRPTFGVELDEDILPPEAGLDDRCIDHRKGCYTGQEVIVRIRDRGKVNRALRGLFLGTAPLPSAGTPLFAAGRERPVGEVRSAIHSSGFAQGIGLGYVRREVEPPAVVRLGSAEGPGIGVRALGAEGWVLVDGDPTLYR